MFATFVLGLRKGRRIDYQTITFHANLSCFLNFSTRRFRRLLTLHFRRDTADLVIKCQSSSASTFIFPLSPFYICFYISGLFSHTPTTGACTFLFRFFYSSSQHLPVLSRFPSGTNMFYSPVSGYCYVCLFMLNNN